MFQRNVVTTGANATQTGVLAQNTLAAIETAGTGHQSGNARASRYQKFTRVDDGDDGEPVAAAGRVRRRTLRRTIPIGTGANILQVRAGETVAGTVQLLN